jgi:hypothetical protein
VQGLEDIEEDLLVTCKTRFAALEQSLLKIDASLKTISTALNKLAKDEGKEQKDYEEVLQFCKRKRVSLADLVFFLAAGELPCANTPFGVLCPSWHACPHASQHASMVLGCYIVNVNTVFLLAFGLFMSLPTLVHLGFVAWSLPFVHEARHMPLQGQESLQTILKSTVSRNRRHSRRYCRMRSVPCRMRRGPSPACLPKRSVGLAAACGLCFVWLPVWVYFIGTCVLYS